MQRFKNLDHLTLKALHI